MICIIRKSVLAQRNNRQDSKRAGAWGRVSELARIRKFAARVKAELNRRGVSRGNFDVTLTSDEEIARLNHEFRGKAAPTDVLSFLWQDGPVTAVSEDSKEMSGFLGDIVISVETAGRNARAEGHSVETEVCQLILHGALHLAGYDHATDGGEMNEIELRLRRALRIEG